MCLPLKPPLFQILLAFFLVMFPAGASKAQALQTGYGQLQTQDEVRSDWAVANTKAAAQAQQEWNSYRSEWVYGVGLGQDKGQSRTSQWVHSTLDGLGMAPGIGIPFDVVNGFVYAYEGDVLNSAISFGAAIPVLGYGANTMRGMRYADEFIDFGRHYGDDIVFGGGRHFDGLLPRSVAGAGDDAGKYLYHYTNPKSADNILAKGFDTRYTADGSLYFTNKGNLSPIQAQIELALPANRQLSGSLLRIDAGALEKAGISPFIGPRRVQGNLPGLGSGGGTEFLFNQNIPSQFIQKVR